MANSMGCTLSLVLATTSGLALAAPALAQVEPAAVAVADTGGDIIVTARRRSESLQETPIAITAITTAQLENKATANIGDLQGAAPNLLITQQNSGALGRERLDPRADLRRHREVAGPPPSAWSSMV